MRVTERPVGVVRFGAFAANLRTGELFKESTKVKLQEQPFKILAMLLERPGDVVSREELRRNLWPEDTLVDFDHGINVAINKIRVALRESSDGRQFVETVGTRGYRFVQAVDAITEKVGPRPTLAVRQRLAIGRRHSVGREKEAAQLRAAFESATTDRGLLVCVTGEAGIGKTTLVENVLADLSTNGAAHLVGRGRCSERLAGTEAYLPILEALESLLHGSTARAVTRLMKRVAPLWHAQVVPVPPQQSGADSTTQLGPASQERLKREFVGFLREVSRAQPLVLFFDDMHWADVSTIDLLGYIGTNLESLRVLIVTTYRPSELFPAKHPFSTLQLDLQTRGLCRETPVQFLSQEDIGSYLELEFPQHRFPPGFSPVIHAKTEGNALFVVDVLRYLKAQHVIADENGHWALVQAIPAIERNMPESVRSMILRKIGQLEETDRHLLVAAAVQGYAFESAVVARVAQWDVDHVEERLDALDRLYGFVQIIDELEFPDGTVTVRYRFVHALYQNAFYSSLGPTRRTVLSQAVAEALLGFYGAEVAPVASKLGFLFESARDPWRASGYYLLAIQNAAQVFARDEVIALARRGLDLLRKVPTTRERIERELNLQVALAFAVSYSRGFGAAVTAKEMTRTLEICEGLGDIPQLFTVWYGLFAYYVTSADLKQAREVGERLLTIADASQDPILLLGAHLHLGTVLHEQGELLAAHDHLERAVALHDPLQIMSYVAIYRTDPGLVARSLSIGNLYLIGYADQAAARMHQTLSLARQSPDRSAAGFPLAFAAFFYQFFGDAGKVLQLADECSALSREYAIPQQQAWVSCVRGWALAESGKVDRGIAEIRTGLALLRALGALVAWPYFLAVLAAAAARAGKTEDALDAISEGLEVAQRYGDHLFEPELHRLKGEVLLMRAAANAREAEDCFRRAIQMARAQGAKALELRAVVSLNRLCLEFGRRDEARQELGEIYGWFTEGFNTPDLKEARAILEQ